MPVKIISCLSDSNVRLSKGVWASTPEFPSYPMNRTSFWILTYLSSVIAILLILQIIFVRITTYDQARLVQRQQLVSEGQSFDLHVRQVAARIYQVSQQTQDQGLKDLLTRQQITIAPNTDATTNAQPATAPATH